MNPIFQWLLAHTVAKSLARRCPRCGRETVAPSTKAHETVPCRKCGTPLPPPRK